MQSKNAFSIIIWIVCGLTRKEMKFNAIAFALFATMSVSMFDNTIWVSALSLSLLGVLWNRMEFFCVRIAVFGSSGTWCHFIAIFRMTSQAKMSAFNTHRLLIQFILWYSVFVPTSNLIQLDTQFRMRNFAATWIRIYVVIEVTTET